jgi:hypothetical protein
MNYNFSHWFLTSMYEVSIYTVHSLHELTAYMEVYLYSGESKLRLKSDPSISESVACRKRSGYDFWSHVVNKNTKSLMVTKIYSVVSMM